jgi:hypothetical protein
LEAKGKEEKERGEKKKKRETRRGDGGRRGALKPKICLRHCEYSSSSKKTRNFISAKTNIMSYIYIYIYVMHLMYIVPMFTIALKLIFSPIIFNI